MREYFVSYDYWWPDGRQGLGNTNAMVQQPIRTLGDVRNVEKAIIEHNQFGKVIVKNYIEFKQPWIHRLFGPLLGYISMMRRLRKIKLEMDEKLPEPPKYGAGEVGRG